ncbi:MAG TPA: hypothetical protein VHN99_11430, partial [Deinococcales bacterium]|nr:hypothetical protein [Deinococcales bacterium]
MPGASAPPAATTVRPDSIAGLTAALQTARKDLKPDEWAVAPVAFDLQPGISQNRLQLTASCRRFRDRA